MSEFDSEDDRDYYLNEDPAHAAFLENIDGIVAVGQVVDFVPGVFLRPRHGSSAEVV